jgi:hypothetical protein
VYICIFISPILFSEPPFGAQETLRAWQKKNHPWLELSDVHKETTENVRVTVIPFYMGCRESQATSVFWVCVQFCFLIALTFRDPFAMIYNIHKYLQI